MAAGAYWTDSLLPSLFGAIITVKFSGNSAPIEAECALIFS